MNRIYRGVWASEKPRCECGVFVSYDRGWKWVCDNCGTAHLEWERREAKA